MTYPAGEGFMLPMYDRKVCGGLIARGEMTRIGWLRQLLTARQAVFAFDDPWPSIGELVGRVRNKLSRFTGTGGQ